MATMPSKNNNPKYLMAIIAAILFVGIMANLISTAEDPIRDIKYSEFKAAVLNPPSETERITEATFQGNNLIGTFGAKGDLSKVRTIAPNDESTRKFLEEHGVSLNFLEPENGTAMQGLIANLLPMILILFVIFFVMRSIQTGGGKAMSFGKSRAKMISDSKPKITFADIAGIDEPKQELQEIIDFLKEPKKFTRLGGRIPKGVLLIGQPGTGKTILAKGIAGEAGVPFFSISGSDFVEMFVGVGASRVRDLFEQAKKNSPCIVFIDEIDAVGRHRGAGMGGGHDEREQTLNQLLVEMDGFEANEGVIIIAATNRADVLDPALLRPGRFDRRVHVPAPDVKGRLGILKVHTKKTPMAADVNLNILAQGTPGFTGADLENLINEAALITARQNKDEIPMSIFEVAKDKVMMGAERKSMIMNEKDRRETAYHEAGHALVGIKTKEGDPVHKVTIIPRGQALGVTMMLPDEDRLAVTKGYAKSMILYAMGGRAAEELIFQVISSGASNDLNQATDIARKMVCNWGMSEKLGPISIGRRDGQEVFMGRGAVPGEAYSQKMAESIDSEVSRILHESYAEAMKILKEHKQDLINIAEALYVKETLSGADLKDILAGKDIITDQERLDFDAKNLKSREWQKHITVKDDGQNTSTYGTPILQPT